MLEAAQSGAREGGDGEVRAIGTMEDLGEILGRLFPSDLPHLVAPRVSSIIAIQGRLRERGYDAAEDLLREYVNDQIRDDSSLKVSPDDQWNAERGTLIRRLQRTAAWSHFSAEEEDGDLLGRFRIAFRRDPWVRAALREVCARLNDAFQRSAQELLPEAELMTVIRSALGLADEPGHRSFARALLLGFAHIRQLSVEIEVDAPHYRRRWVLNASYFINSIFGVTPHVAGLDTLLEGGLLSPPQTGLSMLVEGGPGAGKTTLCLQLTASFAAEGYAVIYLTAEEGAESLDERLSYAGYRREIDGDTERLVSMHSGKRASFAFEISNSIGPDLPLAPWYGTSDGNGSLTIASIANRTQGLNVGGSDLLENLRSIFDDLRERGVPTCLVVDSIDATLPIAPHRSIEERRSLEDLFNFARYRSDIGIFVVEDENPSRTTCEHLADMVIRLDYRERVRAVSERVLEITKCRTQSHLRGQHMFSIHADAGITVYPSVQSKLSIWRRRIRRHMSSQEATWRLDDDFDYDPVLRRDFVEGDAILLTGEPATHKFPVGLSFLAAELMRDREEGEEPNLLLISLREDEATIRRIVANYPQLTPLFRALETREQGPRLKVLHFPPDYFSPERFLHSIEQTLREMKRSGHRVARVLFSAISQLPHSSPMVAKEPLFVAAVIELFKKEGITSLFISAGGGQPILQSVAGNGEISGDDVADEQPVHGTRTGHATFTITDGRSQEIGHVFDTIIFTSKRINPNGTREITLTIGHTAECNASREPVVLRRPTRAKANDASQLEGWLRLETRGVR
jgi:KaiC/GvpD/RAD55 family RecA-like ATPase